MTAAPDTSTIADRPFTVAAIQATPVFLDREATIEKACSLIAEAGSGGARLVVFPEAFVPAYPDWVWAIPAGEDTVLGQLYAELLANAVTFPSPAADRLCQAARQAGVYVAIGLSERNGEASNASLYNTMLYIGDDGAILGKHRKLVPTGGERLVWAPGDGSTLGVFDTPLGRLSGLICWENYMPLARYALYAQGTQLYVAATWDQGGMWLATLRHIAKEGRMVVIGCGMPLRKDDIPDRYAIKQRFYADADEWINIGDSAIVGPDGAFLAGPLRKQEGILYAEVDPRALSSSKWMLDVAGHYARPDVFSLSVDTRPRPMLTLPDASAPAPRAEVVSVSRADANERS
jgi:nitrilase